MERNKLRKKLVPRRVVDGQEGLTINLNIEEVAIFHGNLKLWARSGLVLLDRPEFRQPYPSAQGNPNSKSSYWLVPQVCAIRYFHECNLVFHDARQAYHKANLKSVSSLPSSRSWELFFVQCQSPKLNSLWSCSVNVNDLICCKTLLSLMARLERFVYFCRIRPSFPAIHVLGKGRSFSVNWRGIRWRHTHRRWGVRFSDCFGRRRFFPQRWFSRAARVPDQFSATKGSNQEDT